MSMIRPTLPENIYNTFFELDSSRPGYYNAVIRMGRSFFLSIGFEDVVKEIDDMIFRLIERPMKAHYKVIIEAYYDPQYMFNKHAYTKVGDVVDHVVFTRYDITIRLEQIKDFIYDKVTMANSFVRFTKSSNAMIQ